MDKDTFMELVKKANFLGEVRQQELLENAPWMKNTERQELAEAIGLTKKQFIETEGKIEQMVNEMETAVKTFQKEELPQILQAEESAEHQAEEAEAERLLDEL